MIANDTAQNVLSSATYVPSELDPSQVIGQLGVILALFVCLAYMQFVLTPTAQVKFDLQDKGRRKYIKDLKQDESRKAEWWLYKQWLKPIPRPRGDQTKGGEVIPGYKYTEKGKLEENIKSPESNETNTSK
eukprot:CAMPEP_0196593496 /NCGR_PEP_ID=MMETSP1081-20130531/75797_1 /TAXON_ID=36882 /ORGANISM="Pyramimonas amylifera, Strain CCMP720" /LENGTH=130 /DNA_ID=CAMNT_0041917499 /DNA_START=295 /DNA_END=687 /DNA_ORIENTATION=-